MNVLIVNYNTQRLTDCAIRSLNKHTPGCKVYVFDNSDKEPFRNDFANVEVIDNTHGQFIEWERWLNSFHDKYPNPSNNYGSAKHCKSVDICFDLIPEGFLLMDSDVLIKKDVSDLFDENVAASGEIVAENHYVIIPRLAPWLCYINVPFCRGIRYFSDTHMWKLVNYCPNRFYDTGAWFLDRLHIKKLPVKKIKTEDYALHLQNGSWRDRSQVEFLNKNMKLWQQKSLSAHTPTSNVL